MDEYEEMAAGYSGDGPGVSSGGAQEQRDEVVDGVFVPDEGGFLGTVVSDSSSPTFEEVRFRLAAPATVSPGEFVAVEGRDRDGQLLSWVLCRVLDVHEVNPHEDPESATVRDVLPFDTDYAREGESTVIYRIVRCQPVEELP